MSHELDPLDSDIRYHIYQTFIRTTLPPTTEMTGNHINRSIASIEASYERLARAHQIALAPGSHSI